MNDDALYLLDNNVVSHLSVRFLRRPFFKERCRIPSEVLYEARGHRSHDLLSRVEYKTDAAVLSTLFEVLQTVPASDSKLIDLYRNKGNADPILIACGLLEARKSSQMLVPPVWVVVSNDDPVRQKAEALDVRAISRSEFMSIVSNEADDPTEGSLS